MAFFDAFEEENKKKNGGLVTGSSSLKSPENGAAAETKQNEPKSSGWTNLKAYLDANSGEGQRMGDKVINDSQDELKAVRDATDAWKPSEKQNINNSARYTSVNLSNPDDNSSKDWASFLNPNYNGKAESEFSGNLKNAYDKTKEISNKTESDFGRSQLLNDSYKRSDYGSGMKNFDAFLFGSQGGNKINQLNEFSEAARGYADSAKSDLDKYISSGANSKEIAKQHRDAVDKQINTFGNDMQTGSNNVDNLLDERNALWKTRDDEVFATYRTPEEKEVIRAKYRPQEEIMEDRLSNEITKNKEAERKKKALEDILGKYN